MRIGGKGEEKSGNAADPDVSFREKFRTKRSDCGRLYTIYCVLPTKSSTQLLHHHGDAIFSNVEDRRSRHCSCFPVIGRHG